MYFKYIVIHSILLYSLHFSHITFFELIDEVFFKALASITIFPLTGPKDHECFKNIYYSFMHGLSLLYLLGFKVLKLT